MLKIADQMAHRYFIMVRPHYKNDWCFDWLNRHGYLYLQNIEEWVLRNITTLF